MGSSALAMSYPKDFSYPAMLWCPCWFFATHWSFPFLYHPRFPHKNPGFSSVQQGAVFTELLDSKGCLHGTATWHFCLSVPELAWGSRARQSWITELKELISSSHRLPLLLKAPSGQRSARAPRRLYPVRSLSRKVTAWTNGPLGAICGARTGTSLQGRAVASLLGSTAGLGADEAAGLKMCA